MHDDDKLKLAREAAAKTMRKVFKRAIGFGANAAASRYVDRADQIQTGQADAGDEVQSALAVINALDPQLVEAVGLLREVLGRDQNIDCDYKECPACAFLHRISAFLAKQGDASMAGEKQ